MAASRNEWWRFSEAVAGAYKCGRRIDNPPQVENLPHNSSRRARNVMEHRGYWYSHLRAKRRAIRKRTMPAPISTANCGARCETGSSRQNTLV